MPNVDSNSSDDASNLNGGDPTEKAASKSSSTSTPPMPKHIPFPDYATSSELTFELIMTLFTTGSAVLQLINIYRTNFWLPGAYINNVVNLYLIEPHMFALILLLTTRRLVYSLLLSGIKCFRRRKIEEIRMIRAILKYWFGGTQLSVMGYCIWQIFQAHTYLELFYLTYPIIVYLLIFGFKMEPFLRTAIELDGAYFNGLPLHCCTTNPAHVRNELEVLRIDFNRRFKQVIFTSVSVGYYTALVPCLLHTNVHYNVTRAAQHVIFVWLCAFSLCAVFLFPAKYSDILHRASLHLGHWQRLEKTEGLATTDTLDWCKNSVYGNASIVKHNNVLYRSVGLVSVALPGNASHSRFHKLFYNPSAIYSTLAAFQATIILAEIMFLNSTIEWHYLLSTGFVAFTNHFALFKIVRDYLITKRVYAAENTYSDKPYN